MHKETERRMWLTYCNVNFIVVVWNHTCNISKVCLYEHLKNLYIFVWFLWQKVKRN